MSPIRTQWTRLFRFVTAETSQVHIGQPVDPSLENCGSALDPVVQVSKTVFTVKQFLRPLSQEEVKYVHCLGLNYADNAVLLSFPVLFAKPVTSPTGAGATVVIPKAAQPVKEHCPDYEPVRDVSEANALDYVLGYTAANDVSDRIFTVRQTVAFLSRSTTLKPGSVILTGTPKGVRFVKNPPL
ncbi:fumarylacetoacetate hydrolase [Mycena olivaceomarginata]|nr:fumarylacetoacetate hydrolase [Mycena olivaceomarginata]